MGSETKKMPLPTLVQITWVVYVKVIDQKVKNQLIITASKITKKVTLKVSCRFATASHATIMMALFNIVLYFYFHGQFVFVIKTDSAQSSSNKCKNIFTKNLLTTH